MGYSLNQFVGHDQEVRVRFYVYRSSDLFVVGVFAYVEYIPGLFKDSKHIPQMQINRSGTDLFLMKWLNPNYSIIDEPENFRFSESPQMSTHQWMLHLAFEDRVGRKVAGDLTERSLLLHV